MLLRLLFYFISVGYNSRFLLERPITRKSIRVWCVANKIQHALLNFIIFVRQKYRNWSTMDNVVRNIDIIQRILKQCKKFVEPRVL